MNKKVCQTLNSAGAVKAMAEGGGAAGCCRVLANGETELERYVEKYVHDYRNFNIMADIFLVHVPPQSPAAARSSHNCRTCLTSSYAKSQVKQKSAYQQSYKTVCPQKAAQAAFL